MNTPHPDVERFTLKKIFSDILFVLNLEKGMGYTLKRLLIQPGVAIREYLFENRNRLTRPFQLVLLLVALATFLTLMLLPPSDQLLKDLHESPEWSTMPVAVQIALDWLTTHLKQYFNLFFLLGIPFASLATYWVFRKPGYYFAEHLIINTYVLSPQTFFYILFIPFLNSGPFWGFLQSVVVISYTFFAYKQVFRVPWVEGLWRLLLMFLIYQLLYGIALLILMLFLVVFNS